MKSTNRNSKMNIHILYTESPAPYEQSLLVPLDRGRKKRPFEVSKVRTSGLCIVKLVFSRQTGFFECKHPFIDKTEVFFKARCVKTRASTRQYHTLVQHCILATSSAC